MKKKKKIIYFLNVNHCLLTPPLPPSALLFTPIVLHGKPTHFQSLTLTPSWSSRAVRSWKDTRQIDNFTGKTNDKGSPVTGDANQ